MAEKKELNVRMGEQIRRARECAGYTQERLAETVGVSVQYVSDLERGKVGTSVATLVRICTALHVSSDFILFGRAEQSEPDFSPMVSGLSPHQLQILEEGIGVLVRALAEPPAE